MSNYRGISLLPIAGKIYANIILHKFLAWRDQLTREEQAGFRPGRGTAEQIFTLRQVLDVRHRYQRETYAVFVDFAAAFDSVHRDSLWKIMAQSGAPAKLIRLLKALYNRSSSCVRVFGGNSQFFDINSGVRQGCVISPTLFNFAIDYVMAKACRTAAGIQVGRNLWLKDLDYADDLVIFADSVADAQAFLNELDNVAARIGLRISQKKTKVLGICAPQPPMLTLRGEPIEAVENFCYLGSTVSDDVSCGDEVRVRVGKARAAFDLLHECLWSQKAISRRVKAKVLEMAILPVLLYGGESWPIRVKDLETLEAFAMRCLRDIAEVRWHDFVSNDRVREMCGVRWTVGSILRRKWLQFIGHVVRMAPERWARRMLLEGLRGLPPNGWKKRQGGQKLELLKSVLVQDLQTVNSTRDRLLRDAARRADWRRRIDGI